MCGMGKKWFGIGIGKAGVSNLVEGKEGKGRRMGWGWGIIGRVVLFYFFSS